MRFVFVYNTIFLKLAISFPSPEVYDIVTVSKACQVYP